MSSKRNGIRAEVGERWRFLRRYVRNPTLVGAIAPSSKALAAAVCEPFRLAKGASTVLEVGAGTGAVTRHLGRILREADRLDICEIQPEFADILEHEVLCSPDFIPAVQRGRVRLLRQAVQTLPGENTYDFVISGLPLSAFELVELEEVFSVIRRCLKPDGVFSYFEYVGLRKTSRVLSFGRRRARMRDVSRYLNQNIRAHEFDRHTVLGNFPPAHARHLRFSA